MRYSIGFTPLEYIRFLTKKCSFGLDIDYGTNLKFKKFKFNVKYGRGRDIWSMGLVILSILVNRTETVEWNSSDYNSKAKAVLPPLRCLIQRITNPSVYLKVGKESYYDEEALLTIDQNTLDTDINELESELLLENNSEHSLVQKYFRIVRDMLQINSTKRKSIQELVKLY
jgi:serine/threonine protein kinase